MRCLLCHLADRLGSLSPLARRIVCRHMDKSGKRTLTMTSAAATSVEQQPRLRNPDNYRVHASHDSLNKQNTDFPMAHSLPLCCCHCCCCCCCCCCFKGWWWCKADSRLRLLASHQQQQHHPLQIDLIFETHTHRTVQNPSRYAPYSTALEVFLCLLATNQQHIFSQSLSYWDRVNASSSNSSYLPTPRSAHHIASHRTHGQQVPN